MSFSKAEGVGKKGMACHSHVCQAWAGYSSFFQYMEQSNTIYGNVWRKMDSIPLPLESDSGMVCLTCLFGFGSCFPISSTFRVCLYVFVFTYCFTLC